MPGFSPLAAAGASPRIEAVAVERALALPSEGFRAACLAHEKRLLEQALEECRFNQRRAAQRLALSYDQLRHALRRHGLLDRAAQSSIS